MKSIVFGILILAIIATSVQAQTGGKGEKCDLQQGCEISFPCVEGYCGCPIGKRHEPKATDICTNVVGLKCTRDDDCSVDLPNAKCNTTGHYYLHQCICLKEDNCNGAVSLALFSLVSILFASFIVAKF